MYKVINRYNLVFNKISSKTCKPGDEAKYYKLLRNYRGQGYYLPKLNDDIDRRAIRKNMHHFTRKKKFLVNMISKLEKLNEFPKFDILYSDINETVKELLLLKKKYHEALTDKKKDLITKNSKLAISRLKKQFDTFSNQIFFLKSYRFPNDYLANRKAYENYKYKEKNKLKANELYFYRRLTEDGALDPNKTRPDKYLRTTFDTLFLNIKNEDSFLSENVRYDLNWMGRQLKKVLKRGKSIQLKRLKEWHNRITEQHKFYKEIIKLKNKNKSKFIVKKENEASRKLKEFVNGKQKLVYELWSKEKELNKALYSLETILVNEVGVIDGKHGLERAAVAKVVFNRYKDDFYNQLDPNQPLAKLIDDQINISKEHWLNVLFRVGEFSFTYHYISGVVKIFCPDMSRRGRGIRNKNLKIILKASKTYDKSFKAFRYFSRVSMMGKIDMSSVWSDYVRLPEQIGYESLHQRRLMTYYIAGKYQYYYSFVDIKGIEFNVISINERTYSMRLKKGKPVFFDYRNPHLFAYFSKKK